MQFLAPRAECKRDHYEQPLVGHNRHMVVLVFLKHRLREHLGPCQDVDSSQGKYLEGGHKLGTSVTSGERDHLFVVVAVGQGGTEGCV